MTDSFAILKVRDESGTHCFISTVVQTCKLSLQKLTLTSARYHKITGQILISTLWKRGLPALSRFISAENQNLHIQSIQESMYS